MAKYLKKKKKKPVALILILVLVLLILLAAFAIFIMPQLLYRLSGGGEENLSVQTEPQSMNMAPTDAVETTEPPIPTVQFPLLVDDGRLEMNSLFQFTGLNPDCGNQEGTDIAGIQLRNASDSQLTQATIEMTLLSGKLLRFTVEDLPAGMTALVFSDENLSMAADDVCVSFSCETSFEAERPLMADRLSVSVEGTQITVTNISGDDLNDLTVYCHCLLDQDCYGGVTYRYSIESLPAGGSATVDAVDCYLGDAEVVRIGMADQ